MLRIFKDLGQDGTFIARMTWREVEMILQPSRTYVL